MIIAKAAGYGPDDLLQIGFDTSPQIMSAFEKGYVHLTYVFYCTLWGGADAIWHECGHRTAFKTRKLNDFFYTIASYMNNFEPVRWRWSHSLHHSYTASIDPHDYEVDGSIFANHSLISFLFIFVPGSSFLTLHKSLHLEIVKHAFGIETKVMKDCIPEDKKKDCINSSRIFVLLWLSTLALDSGNQRDRSLKIIMNNAPNINSSAIGFLTFSWITLLNSLAP